MPIYTGVPYYKTKVWVCESGTSKRNMFDKGGFGLTIEFLYLFHKRNFLFSSREGTTIYFTILQIFRFWNDSKYILRVQKHMSTINVEVIIDCYNCSIGREMSVPDRFNPIGAKIEMNQE